MAAVDGEERKSSIKDMQPGLCPAEDSVPFNEGTEPQISSSSTVNEKRELPSKADILKADPSESQWRRPSVTHKLNDVCADLFLEADELGQQRLEELNRRVKWKLDLIIMPIVACTHALQFLNKSSPNFVAALGIIPELGLQHGRYAWVRRHMTSTLFLHTNKEPGRRHIQFWLRCMVVPDQHDHPTCANCQVYGFCRAGLVSGTTVPKMHRGQDSYRHRALLQMCAAATTNYAGILVIRFLLGMFEAAIAPSAMNIVSLWYTRDEAPFRLCIVLGCNGGAWVIASLLSYGVGHVTHAAVRPWQLYFLLCGVLNFIIGVIFLIFVPDTPHNAWWLTREEKVCATWRTSKNMVGTKNKIWKKAQALEVFTDFKVWCTWIMASAIGIIIGGVVNFSSALVESFGYSGIHSTILQLPIGAIAFVVVPAAGLFATLVPNTRCLMVILLCLPPLAGLIGIR